MPPVCEKYRTKNYFLGETYRAGRFARFLGALLLGTSKRTKKSVRELGPREAIWRAIQNKPEKGAESHTNTFYAVGG
ncbi:MAG: hypothetical protein HOK67_06140 [Deltaproteobacteria bacterium]|nr:hypothetical protein [Deltaproteobacteria bacterium]MBT6499466.1 hypothetical protein [Deltaproteobacteria bacterium]MBT7712208.1 hypothetical protein [Deltaproteobacteria bacterium]